MLVEVLVDVVVLLPHFPSAQTPAQVAPQDPQFLRSVKRLTQVFWQLVWPVGQAVAHFPAVQLSPDLQALVQAPQWDVFRNNKSAW